MNGFVNLGIAALVTVGALVLVMLFIGALVLSAFIWTSQVFSLVGKKHRHDRESERRDFPVLIVEHVEQPSEN